MMRNKLGEEKEKVGWRDQFSSLKNLGPFFTLIWRTSPSLTIYGLLCRLLKAAIPTAALYVGKLIIDEVIRLSEGGGELTYIWKLVAIELILALADDLLNRGLILTDSLLGDQVAIQSSVEIMDHAAKLDLFHFEQAEFYDKLERARQQTRGRTTLLSQILAQIEAVITIAFLAVGIVAFSPWLILLVVVAVIPGFFQENYFNQRTYSLTRSWTPERRELDYLRYIGASDTTAKEVKIFGLADFIVKRFRELSLKYYEVNKALSLRRAGWGALFAALASLAYYGAYVLIILQTVRGLITVGTLTFLAGSFRRIQSSLRQTLSRFSKIAEGALYLQDFYDFLALQPNIVSGEKGLNFPDPVTIGWEFQNVTFRYPNAEQDAVTDLSFILPAGKKLALVGENGAGKTTLVKLFSRLYEPDSGRILLDGIDLKEYDLTDLRRNVGVIFQDFFRYQLTAGENIAIGRIEQSNNEYLIRASAEKSLAAEVIEELPGGYDQLLGRRFKGGTDLSGGQWQKIALGRAYMRNAQLLILDEPTSALDARAEYEVFQRFSELIRERTAILISHRFSTVRMADIILFIENGKRLEMGSHDELIELKGRYAELFWLQAEGYQ
ncbi:ABC transporter ATP-binding protein [Lewinellaceae bacterium SD302]|nr:ABC transporter ATP-binding protein [Lewinellaceae bacterium SD302]